MIIFHFVPTSGLLLRSAFGHYPGGIRHWLREPPHGAIARLAAAARSGGEAMSAYTPEGCKVQVPGVAPGPSGAETFWTDFRCGLTDRGLCGVKLAIADDQKDLRAAAGRAFDAKRKISLPTLKAPFSLGPEINWIFR